MIPFGFFRLSPFRLFKICLLIAGVFTCSNIGSIAQFIRQPQTTQPVQKTNYANPPSSAMPQTQDDSAAVQQQDTAQQASGNRSFSFDTEKLSLSEKPFDFRRDWWKYSLMLISVAISGYFLTRIGTALLRLMALVFCILFSAASAYLFGPLLEPLIRDNFTALPADKCPPIAIAYFIIFLCAYIVAYLIVRLLRRPVEPAGKKKNGKG
ncbi:MAG: hypothetical protein J6X55_01165 [Victivallales bacterium]|nr:hypothetical protein [Victivallales bacterium]